MSTRKLILAALACGLVILVAGGVFLVTLAGNRDELTVPALLAADTSAEVDGVELAYLGPQGTAGAAVVVVVRVRVSPEAADITDAAQGWALLQGSPRPPVAVPDGEAACDGLAVPAGTTTECALAFERGEGSGYLEYARGDERARWVLDA